MNTRTITRTALMLVTIAISTCTLQPTHAASHQSCTGRDLVIIRVVYRVFPGRFAPVRTYERTIFRNHPLCRAER